MKKIIGIALALVLTLGMAAFAETAPQDAPGMMQEQPEAPADQTPAAEEEAPAEDEETKAEDDGTALKDAMDAYRAARAAKNAETLEEELNGYVEDGSMTQEQADLILNKYKEQQARRNGECPNCGYKFSNNGQNCRGMKGFGGKMQQNGQHQRGQMPQNNRMPQNGQQPQRGQQQNGQMQQNGQRTPAVSQN